MVRCDTWKYVFYGGTGGRTLFDLSSDPGETRNRAGDPAVRGAEQALHERLLAWHPALGR